jgi:hypothetical protein
MKRLATFIEGSHPVLALVLLIAGLVALVVGLVRPDFLSVNDTFADWATVAGAFFAAAGLFSAAEQNAEQRRWRSKEFVAAFMRDFLSHEEVRDVLRMLDYSPRRLQLVGATDTLVAHEWRADVTAERLKQNLEANQVVVLRLALRPSPRPSVEWLAGFPDHERARIDQLGLTTFSQAEARVRDKFDFFFDGLEQVLSFSSDQLEPLDDLAPYLRYCVSKMGSEGLQDCLTSYLDKYQYEQIPRLMAS